MTCTEMTRTGGALLCVCTAACMWQVACRGGFAECVRHLLRAHASPDAVAECSVPARALPLHVAVRHGHSTCVQLLLHASGEHTRVSSSDSGSAGGSSGNGGGGGGGGGTIDCPLADGSTALMLACGGQHARAVELLLGASASLAPTDSNGRTALDVACGVDGGAGDALIVALLMERAAADEERHALEAVRALELAQSDESRDVAS